MHHLVFNNYYFPKNHTKQRILQEFNRIKQEFGGK
jgi:hypothetical protein